MKGFEELTAPLNEEERELVPYVRDIVRQHVGKQQAISGSLISTLVYTRTDVRTEGPVRLSGARLRKIINHIRLTGEVELLAATSTGYFVATDPAEAREYISSLGDRILAMEKTLAAFNEQCSKQGIFQINLFPEE